jgi:hypothetical protein
MNRRFSSESEDLFTIQTTAQITAPLSPIHFSPGYVIRKKRVLKFSHIPGDPGWKKSWIKIQMDMIP